MNSQTVYHPEASGLGAGDTEKTDPSLPGG